MARIGRKTTKTTKKVEITEEPKQLEITPAESIVEQPKNEPEITQPEVVKVEEPKKVEPTKIEVQNLQDFLF